MYLVAKKKKKIYRKYSIDAHLNRWESALKNLARAGPEYVDTCIEIVRKHGLYNAGLEAFPRDFDPESHNRMLELMAKNLEQSSDWQACGMAYEACGKLNEAVESYVKVISFNSLLCFFFFFFTYYYLSKLYNRAWQDLFPFFFFFF